MFRWLCKVSKRIGFLWGGKTSSLRNKLGVITCRSIVLLHSLLFSFNSILRLCQFTKMFEIFQLAIHCPWYYVSFYCFVLIRLNLIYYEVAWRNVVYFVNSKRRSQAQSWKQSVLEFLNKKENIVLNLRNVWNVLRLQNTVSIYVHKEVSIHRIYCSFVQRNIYRKKIEAKSFTFFITLSMKIYNPNSYSTLLSNMR